MDNFKRVSILLADEQVLVREGLASLCERSGQYTVVNECDDGSTAFERVQLLQPDIAILATTLPQLHALEIVKKSRMLGSATKFIILSPRPDRKLAMDALRSGANGFVLKCGPTRHLLDALQQVSAGGVYVSPDLEFAKMFLSQKKSEMTDPIDTLSSREYQVFTLLIDGFRAKEIAARLELSPKTVDTYRASLMRKLDIHDVAGLVKFAVLRELTSVA